jgi:hypothetical protein
MKYISGVRITFTIIAYLEQLGYSPTAANLAYDSLISQISSSVISGQFQTNMKLVSLELNSTSLDNITVSNDTFFGNYSINIITTALPTVFPSLAPPIIAGKESRLQGGAIAGIVIAILTISCVACAMYVYFGRQNTSGSKFKLVPIANNNDYDHSKFSELHSAYDIGITDSRLVTRGGEQFRIL